MDLHVVTHSFPALRTSDLALRSLLSTIAHGFLLAQVVVSYQAQAGYLWFSLFIGLCAVAAYCLLGASWLIMRVAGELRARAVMWGRRAVRWSADRKSTRLNSSH